LAGKFIGVPLPPMAKIRHFAFDRRAANFAFIRVFVYIVENVMHSHLQLLHHFHHNGSRKSVKYSSFPFSPIQPI
jgi:hypothetical protein